MNNNIKFFAQFTKKDDDQRIVEGYASSEALDSQGEVVKITAIEKALPDYMKFGNVREMHQWSAVGKTVSANIDKAKKGLYLVAKVIDKDAWEKCKEGVYNGFSIGGKVLKRVNNVIEDLSLNEISLVDRPANPEAVFAMVKMDKNGVMVETQPQEPEAEDESVYVARYILDLAADIRMLLNKFEREGKSLVELNKALTALKTLAVKILSVEDHKKFEKVLYGIDFGEVGVVGEFRGVREEQKEEKDIKKFVDHNWTDGYFDDLRKVI